MPKYHACPSCSGKGETLMSGMTITCPECRGFLQVMAKKELAPKAMEKGTFEPQKELTATVKRALPKLDVYTAHFRHVVDFTPPDSASFLSPDIPGRLLWMYSSIALKAFYGKPLGSVESKLWDLLHDDSRTNASSEELHQKYHTLVFAGARQSGKSTMAGEFLKWELEQLVKRNIRKEYSLGNNGALTLLVVGRQLGSMLTGLFEGSVQALSGDLHARSCKINKGDVLFKSDFDTEYPSIRLKWVRPIRGNVPPWGNLHGVGPLHAAVVEEAQDLPEMPLREFQRLAYPGKRPRVIYTGSFTPENVPAIYDQAFEARVLSKEGTTWDDPGILLCAPNVRDTAAYSVDKFRAMEMYSRGETLGLRWEDRLKHKIRDTVPSQVVEALQEEGLDSEAIERILVRLAHKCI